MKDQSVKVKAAVSTRRGKGEYCCGSAPYGYRINPENKKELVIVEDEAEVIRRVFELTNQRYSKIEICRLFNEDKSGFPLLWNTPSESSRTYHAHGQYTENIWTNILLIPDFSLLVPESRPAFHTPWSHLERFPECPLHESPVLLPVIQ